MKSFISLTLMCLLCYSESYKILVMFPLPIKSVSILGQGIVKNLLSDGHEVTFITTHPMNKPQKNLREIDISQNLALFENDGAYRTADVLDNKVKIEIKHMQDMGLENARQTFENENVTKLLKNRNEHFDAVIVDLFESELYAGLSVLYNCPMMWAFSMGAHWEVVRLIGDPSSPAYESDYYSTNIPPFTFVQRVEELFTRVKWSFYKTFYTLPAEREVYEQLFGPVLAERGRKLPDYDDVIFNASMIFGNEHNAVYSKPSTPQNFKYIGGIHIDDAVQPLPKDLQELMDNSLHGVIYFSMGSFWNSKDLPMKLTRELLQMFGELKQNVIWKYEENLNDVPKNVHIIQWAPQLSILAHPNCKVFISHGGLLSSIEAIHFGVPIIGVPLLFDQITNVLKAAANGYAIKIDIGYDLPKKLKIAINTMTSNENYRKRVLELSKVYHDRPMKPGQELAYWVSHVVRTNGAWHLRSPAVTVPLYQRLYLDLLVAVMGLTFVLLFALFLILKSKKENKFVVKKKKH